MSIAPQLISNTGSPQGTSIVIADIQRQIAGLVVSAGSLAPGSVTGDRLVVGTLTASEIAAGTITAAQIAAGTITAAQIAAGTITSTEIATGAITAGKINVPNLAAVSATMGTVTGGIFQTQVSGSRVMMGSSMTTPSGVTAGIVGIDNVSNVTFSLDANTGNVELKGKILTGSSGLGNIAGVTQNATLAIAGANLLSNPFVASTDITPFSGTNYTISRDTVTFMIGPASVKGIVTAAGAASLFLAETGWTGSQLVNLVPNPSFETDTVGSAPAAWVTSAVGDWLSAGATLTAQTASDAPFGAQAMRVVTTAALAGEGAEVSLGVLPVGTYTVSAYVKGNAGGETLTLFGGPISPGIGDATVNFTATTSFVRKSVTFTTDGVAACYVGVKTQTAAAVTFFVDAVQVVSGSTLITYFDGDTPGFYWPGTRGNSTSRQYVIGPVTAGGTYSFAVYFLAAVSRVVTPQIDWVDINGTFISTSTGTAVTTLAGQWTRIPFENVTAPALTTQVHPSIQVAGCLTNEQHNYAGFIFVNQPTASGGQIVTNSITATEIAAGTITAVQIAAVSIIGSNIAAGTITAGNIAAGAITATKIAAAAIDGMTITGALIQTAAGGVARTFLNSTGVGVTDAGGVTTLATLDATNGLRLTAGTYYSAVNSLTFHRDNTAGAQVGSVGGFYVGTKNLASIGAPVGGSNNSLTVNSDSTTDANNSVGCAVWNAAQTVLRTNTLLDSTGKTTLGATSVASLTSTGGIVNTGGQIVSIGQDIVAGNLAQSAKLGQQGFVEANSGAGGSPANSVIQMRSLNGSLPGFPANNYPTLFTNFTVLYVAVNSAWEGFFSSAGVYTAVSSAASKTAFTTLDPDTTLLKIDALNLSEWEHIADPGVRRIGPIAEDFQAQFGLGHYIADPAKRTRPEHAGGMIAAADVAGVALAGVQALYARITALESKVALLPGPGPPTPTP